MTAHHPVESMPIIAWNTHHVEWRRSKEALCRKSGNRMPMPAASASAQGPGGNNRGKIETGIVLSTVLLLVTLAEKPETPQFSDQDEQRWLSSLKLPYQLQNQTWRDAERRYRYGPAARRPHSSLWSPTVSASQKVVHPGQVRRSSAVGGASPPCPLEPPLMRSVAGPDRRPFRDSIIGDAFLA